MADDPQEAPWSVAWAGEQAFRLQPSRDFPGRIELNQKQAPGVGQPMFAAIHVTRQRRGMVHHICHCGQPTRAADRYIFPTASGGLVTLHDGTQQYGCNVPPMHLACADRARAVCPHLSRIDEPPLRCTADEGRLIERTDITPGLEGIAGNPPPGVQAVLPYYRLYGQAFTAQVLKAREPWEATARRRRRSR